MDVGEMEQEHADTYHICPKMMHTSDMAQQKSSDLRGRILYRTAETPNSVWTPGDFADLATRTAVDKTMQRPPIAVAMRHHREDKRIDLVRPGGMRGTSTEPQPEIQDRSTVG